MHSIYLRKCHRWYHYCHHYIQGELELPWVWNGFQWQRPRVFRGNSFLGRVWWISLILLYIFVYLSALKLLRTLMAILVIFVRNALQWGTCLYSLGVDGAHSWDQVSWPSPISDVEFIITTSAVILIITSAITILSTVAVVVRGKIMSQRASKLQRPFLANSIYCSDPISKMSKTAARHEQGS